MIFKSLLFKNEKSKIKTDMQVFEDVKLTSLLPENVLSVMSRLASKEDILLRIEFFKKTDAGLMKLLSALRQRLYKLKEDYAVFERSSKEAEKDCIFSTLLYDTLCFYKEVTMLDCDCFFAKRFCEVFKGLCDDRFDKAMEDTVKLYSDINRRYMFTAEQTRVVFSEIKAGGFVSELKTCADKMGIELTEKSNLNRKISAQTCECYSKLYPEAFAKLKALREKYSSFTDKSVLEYADELDFYISIYELKSRVEAAKIPTCYPDITDEKKISITQAYDITLLTKECDEIIPNDITFEQKESLRFLVGANGGGKTTYLRNCAVGVIFALNGCFVPARAARVCELSSVMTHFPSDERFDSNGRFYDEQSRVEDILAKADENTLVLLNETYSTTNESNAQKQTLELAKKILNIGLFSIFVTHQKSVFESGIPVLSCIVDENDNNRRTYKIKPINSADGSFANDILEKYSLSEKALKERFGI